MSTLTVTIGGNPVTILANTFDLEDNIDTPSVMRFTVYDATGTQHFTHGQNVLVSDSVYGVFYAGFVNTSQETKLVPRADINSVIDCMDNQYLLNKRVNFQNYLNWYSGDIVADLCSRILSQEGVVASYAIRHEWMQSDFAQGTQQNTFANFPASATGATGDLELALAGTATTIFEQTTAQFASGTLSGVTAQNNTLFPMPQAAILLQGTITGSPLDADLYMQFSGLNKSISSGDIFNYAVWIASGSPTGQTGIDFVCTDGTTFRDSGILDQNGYSCHPHTDLSTVATNQFYVRAFDLTPLHGKTVDYCTAVWEKNSSAGTYTAYFRNITINNSTVFFATNATQLPLYPPVTLKNTAYYPTYCTVVKTYDTLNATRISPAYSLDATKLVRSSMLAYVSTAQPSSLPSAILTAASSAGSSSSTVPQVQVQYSIDGGVTYQIGTNNAPLPNLLAGQSVAGVSLLLQEVFVNGSGDPTQYAVLSYLTVAINPACGATLPAAIAYTASTPAQWNGGTLTNVATGSNGDISTVEVNRTWSTTGSTIAGQTLWGNGSPAQAVASSALQLTTGPTSEVVSQFNFAGNTWKNCQIEFDMLVDNITTLYGCVYRTTYWGNTDGTWAYEVSINASTVNLNAGSNSSGGGINHIATITFVEALQLGTWYHIQVNVQGSVHKVYVDGVLQITATDGTFPNAGGVGLRQHNTIATAYTANFNNYGVSQVTSVNGMNGVWLGPSQLLSTLVKAGNSVIYWDTSLTQNPVNTSVVVSATTNGGTTWTPCTNGGPIPGVGSGQVMTGVSLQIMVALTTSAANAMPDIRNLVWRALPLYSATGVRSTAPLGNDTMVRGNVAIGWGTAFDGQSYTKVGTGTVALTSNEGLISATTGDVEMVYGTATAADQDGTLRFFLSASALAAGLELRRVDANNFYRLSATTTLLSLSQKVGGTLSVLTTSALALSLNTAYRMRFRVVGSGPVTTWGRVWADGTLEPGVWNVTFTQ